MSVKIRLARTGRKNLPFFRVVVMDSRKKRDGRFLENVGAFDPISGKIIKLDEERVNYWVSNGAILSDTVKGLCKSFSKTSEKPVKKAEAVEATEAPEKPKKVEKKVVEKPESSEDTTK